MVLWLIQHMSLCGEQGLWGKDGSHLKKWGKNMTNRLTKWMRRGLNWVCCGMAITAVE